MPRLRSIAIVALLWVAALAGSSAPDGFGGPRRIEPLIAGTFAHTEGDPRNGKRWAIQVDVNRGPGLPEDRGGKRWT